MKKIKKRLLPVSLLALLPLFLTACASQTSKNGSLKAPTSGPYYWIYEWIGLPLQHITVNIAHAIGGASGAGHRHHHFGRQSDLDAAHAEPAAQGYPAARKDAPSAAANAAFAKGHEDTRDDS